MRALIEVVIVLALIATSYGWWSTSQDLSETERSLGVTAGRIATLDGENNRLQGELKATKETMALATIVGYAFVDTGVIGQLGYDDRSATGLVIELYKAVKELPTGETEWTLIGNAKVDSRGMYEFKVTPGEYYVVPVLAIPGYPSWSSAHHLKGGLLSVAEGKVVIGPTFLVRQYSGKG